MLSLLLLSLVFPSTAWATQKMQIDPNTLGALLAALLTTLGGGGYYLKRQRDGTAGRDELSIKTKAAIARDNADQVLREKIGDYRDSLASLRSDVHQLQMVATQALQTAQQATQAANAATIASQTLAEEIRHIRADVDRRFSESAQANQMERLLGPLADLERKLSRAIEITERKGGGYGSE